MKKVVRYINQLLRYIVLIYTPKHFLQYKYCIAYIIVYTNTYFNILKGNLKYNILRNI